MELTVDWFINDSGISDLRCVAGKSNLSNRMSSINVIDNCDVLRWVNKDEFAMTTGFSFRDSEQAQTQIIRDLKQAGSSGLGIKIKRFFDRIPQCMIDTANEVGLPLIEIPYYYRFAEISNRVFVMAHEVEIRNRNRGPKLLLSMSELFYSNSGIGQLLSHLSEELGRICILTQLNSVMAYHIPTALLNQFSGSQKNMEIRSAGYGREDERDVCYYKINDRTIPFVNLPLPGSTGNILIEESCTSTELAAARHTLHLFSMELDRMRSLSHDVSRGNYYDMFYEMLLDPNQRSNDNLKTIYDYYGFDYTMKRVCLTLRFSKDITKEKLKDVTEAMTAELSQNRISYFMCSHTEDISIFVYFPADTKTAIAVSDCVAIGNELYSAVCHRLELPEKERPCVIGIGRCHKRINTVSTSYIDSVKAVQLSHVGGMSGYVSTYFSQIPYHVLSVLKPEELFKIYHDSIMQLSDYDRENNTELVSTLKTYFACKFNATETAKLLFLHRNTFARRMEKIKSILCVDMTNIDEMISLYLGICAMELLES